MQSSNYKESLAEALRTLVEVNERIYDSLIYIETQGELKEWNDSVPVGEVHQFDFELFRNSDDTNIQLLVKLIEKVDETYRTIKSMNGIEMEQDA
jgi:hypothetical protein